MSRDNEPNDCTGSLEVIHEAGSEPPSIDVIAVHWLGSDDLKESTLLEDLCQQINARSMLFNTTVKDDTDSISTEGLTRLAGRLLRQLSLERLDREAVQGTKTPIAFVAYGLGGVIVKKALVMAESDATYYSISQECNQLAIYRYSATTGLVHDANFSRRTKHKDVHTLSAGDPVFAAIGNNLKAETEPEYRKCLSRLFEISPMFTVPDDQRDLYMSEPSPEVQNAYDGWLEIASSCIITTSGDWGVGKSLNARALFHRVKRSSKVVAYYSFAGAEEWSQNSLGSFLGSVVFQVLNQDPERFSRVQDLFAAMEASTAWTEAGLLVLFQSLMDTTKGLNPLHLVVDDLQNCESARELVDVLTAIVASDKSSTKLKVALFYNRETPRSQIIEDALRVHDTYRMYGPSLTPDTLIPLATTLSDEAISSKPYLVDLQPQLSAALKKCKNTTEMLLKVQSLDISNAGSDYRTLKYLESVVSSPQLSLRDVVASKFEALPGWGMAALGWIAHSRRPLRLDELATAVALTNSMERSSSAFDPKDLPVDFAIDVRSLFGPLVRLEGGGLVFSDKAVRNGAVEMFATERKIELAAKRSQKAVIPGDVEITRILLRYLSQQEFVVPVNEALRAAPQAFVPPPGRQFDLITYAVQYLPFHYRACKSSGDLPDLSMSRQVVVMWSRLNSQLNSKTSPPYVCVADPLLLAAQLGLTETVKALGKNIMPEYRQIAISLASWGGYVDTANELLVGECADNTRTTNTAEALEYAAARGHDRIINVLLKYMDEKEPQGLSPLLNRLLCQAAELGYEKQASMWVERGADVNAAPDNITPLQHAVHNGHASLVHYLLDREADVNSNAGTCTDTPMDKPILLAARKGHELVVQYLLAAQADITCLTKDGITPLYLAAEYGHLTIVRRLLAAEISGHSVVNHQSSGGTSPLIIACTKGHSEIAKTLLSAGASIKSRDSDGNTALYHVLGPNREDFALEVFASVSSFEDFKHEDICDVFFRAAELGFDKIIDHCWKSSNQEARIRLKRWSDPGDERRSPLHIAAANGHVRVARLLLDLGFAADLDPEGTSTSELKPLALAAEAGEEEIVELLLQRGANPFVPMPDGQTILSRVARYSKDSARHAKVVRLLKSVDIDPNSFDEYEYTALHWAVIGGKLEITRALLQHPTVNPNVTTREYGWNALHYLADDNLKSTKELGELLIIAGTDPLGLDVDNWLPIHVASRSGNVQMLELLWKHNQESIEASADDGSTPLHFGIKCCELASIRWLMEHGANGNARGPLKHTPLMMAAYGGSDEPVRILCGYNCDAKMTDEDGGTALHFAARSGAEGAARELLKRQIGILSARDKINLSALHQAIRNSKIEFAAMLLDDFYPIAGADTRLDDLRAQSTVDGETPLISAVTREQDGIVRRLLELGAETEYRDHSGYTALLAALERPYNLRILTMLLDPNAPNHVDVNAGGQEHPTALHNAAKYGNFPLVKTLIGLGAQVNAQGGQYNTALSAAAASGYHIIAMYLLDFKEQKADPNLPAGGFANALSAALYSQSYELIAPLIQAGVDVNATDIQGRSALHIAARRGSWDVYEELQDRMGSITSLVDKQGRTLIHHAAMSGKPAHFLQVLVHEDWADFDIKDLNGWTPLHWACRQDANLSIVQALVRLGVDLTRATDDGWTPENIAVTHDAGEIAAYIRENMKEKHAPGLDETVRSMSPGFGSETTSGTRWKVGHVHPSVACDGCLLYPVVGTRWHCNKCNDVDFCFKCYWSAKEAHYPHHDFTAIPEGGYIGRTPEIEDLEQKSDRQSSDESEDEDEGI
ncbi:hypothetical protein VMCG_02079 [Cytospora schulzeri]|uniref:ZZ-type domain-containing protein n=1 Tax=Cytospora schulzeri TaxID=448051 RepID=A0A423X2V2_9PEZI|nr:hypothetical protein VMCG_02079 [Valsa malicola]